MAGRGTPATSVLARAKVPHTVHEYAHDPAAPAYGAEAAEALGIPAQRVFKTLIADVQGLLYVGLVPVTGGLDLKALAQVAGRKKATMADPAAAERTTGYVRGGISPLGQRRRLPTVVDRSATGFATVYVSAGRRGLEVELAPDDLIRLTAAAVAEIAT